MRFHILGDAFAALLTTLVAGPQPRLHFTQCIWSICGGFGPIPDTTEFHHASPLESTGAHPRWRTGAFGWGLGAVIKASETTKDKKQRHQKDRRKTRVNQSNGSNNNLARESRAFHLQGCLHLLNIPSCSAPSALRQLNLDKQIYRLNCRVTPVTPDPNERSRQGTRTTRTTNTALHSAASA